VIDHRHTDLSQIPDEFITAAKQNLKIRYFRRSHGSHIDTGGMDALRTYYASLNKYQYSKYDFAKNDNNFLYFSTQWASLDKENTTWVQITTDYLDNPANADINVVMWAWSSDFYLCSAQQYLDDMETLIAKYGPGGTAGRAVPITFIFQTACGQRVAERNSKVYEGNQLIRLHCNTHSRILFDFNDLECYDPDGNYFGDGNPDGSYTSERMLNDDLAYISSNPGGSIYTNSRNWGIDWMNAHPTSELAKLAADNICTVCEHSMGTFQGETKDNSRLHCVLKGRAAWWMWAVLAGWEAGATITSAYVPEKLTTTEVKNFPNPFTENTIIEYQLDKKATVKLSIWNSNGQLIKVLVDKSQGEGNYQIPVELENSKGVYYYTLDIDGKRTAKKMIKL